MDANPEQRVLNREEAADLIDALHSKIMQEWEERVREVVPAARPLLRPVLRDSLPGFVTLLARALREGECPREAPEAQVPERQSRLRAELPGFTLDQVIREYQVLRKVVLAELTRERFLEPTAQQILADIFDAAIREAAVRFSREVHGALSRLEHDHQLMVESTRDFAILTLDPEGRIRSWNPGAEQLFGLSADEVIGQSTEILFVPEDRDRGVHLQEMRTATREGRAEDERWHQRADGRRFFASGVLVPLRNGEFRGYAKVLRDVTPRKLAEDERDRLLVSEQDARARAERNAERLRRLQSVTDVALTAGSLDELLGDLLRRVQEALEADTAGLLLKEGDWLVLRAARGLDAEVHENLRIPVGAGFVGQIASTRQPLALEDTQLFPLYSDVIRERGICSLLGVPLCVEGEVVGVLHVGTRTRRRFDEEEIRLLQLVGDRAALAIERTRLSDDVHRRSSHLETLAGTAHRLLGEARPDEFVRTLFHELAQKLDLDVYLNYLVREDGGGLQLSSCAGLPDDVIERVRELRFVESVCGKVAQMDAPYAGEGGDTQVNPKTELIRSLGITAYACHPLLAGDDLIGTLSFGSRGRAAFDPDELALMHALADQVAIALQRARLLEELQRRAEELEDADRRKDEFLATLAHELRNPLSGISNAAYVLGQSKDEQQRIRLEGVIRRQAEHLSRMVDDLLDLSRITHGKIELRKETIELGPVLRQAVEAVRPLIVARAHHLSVEMPDEPLRLRADPTRVEQILTNLLNNAAKYTDPGGTLTLTAAARGAEVEIQVRDTGIGIPRPLIGRIFDLFAQSERSLDRAEGGLGIGLSLVKRLVELHGGSIEARSEGSGKGSTFTVRLPMAAGRGAGGSEAAAETALPQTRRVLVVEDNQDAAETLCEILQLWGMDVSHESSGPGALRTFPVCRPEVVLMDIGLPEMDGYAVAAELRRRFDLSDTLLIALTGYGQEEDRRRAVQAGFDHHMVKPVDPEELSRILARGKNGPANREAVG